MVQPDDTITLIFCSKLCFKAFLATESDKLSLCLVISTSTCVKILGIYNIRILSIDIWIRMEAMEIIIRKISDIEFVQRESATAKLV